MEPSRIKNPALADQIDDGQLVWYHYLAPLTAYYAGQIAQRDYRGKKLAYWGHITLQNAANMMLPLMQAGVELVVGACNVDSTNDAMAAYLAAKGIHVYGWSGMSQSDYQENLSIVRSFEADYLCDMGGELCVAYLDKNPPVRGALEATTSGLNLLAKHNLPFPVFNWNDIPLKNLHNRYHVGDTVWPAFNQLTGMSLYGRRVLVIGCGSVGKGIAERAHDLGAIVYVADLDPVRLLEARHLGCEAVDLEQGLAYCQIIVTATGIEGVLNEETLRRVRPGTILFNAGHSNREIDIDWLSQQPHQRMKAHIERYDLGQTYLFLLAQGSLLNLAAGAGPYGVDMFDHYVAVMLLGIAWMFDGMPDNIAPGLQAYPAHLEHEIAHLSMKLNT
jgi:adenosylhomocysteinase